MSPRPAEELAFNSIEGNDLKQEMLFHCKEERVNICNFTFTSLSSHLRQKHPFSSICITFPWKPSLLPK